LLLALSVIVISDGAAGVRISQIWGPCLGTLYPGVHFIAPLVDSVALYDTREQVYSTLAAPDAKAKGEVLTVQAREGLNLGLAVSVRYRLDPKRLDSIHTNFNYSRSWFQNPNTYDQLNVMNVVSGGTGPSPVFDNIGDADQRSKIGTYNIAPTYTRIISPNSVLNVGGFVRRDGYNYYPSSNPLADLGPRRLRHSASIQVTR